MIRAVLAVAATAALLAASLPAVDDARRQHTEGVTREEAESLERAARSLVETEDVTRGGDARRIVAVTLPERGWAHAGLEGLVVAGGENATGRRTAAGGENAIGGPDATGGRVAWTVSGGRRTTYRIEGIALRTSSGEPVRLRGAGRRRLVLALGGTPRHPVVTVRRFDPTADATIEGR